MDFVESFVGEQGKEGKNKVCPSGSGGLHGEVTMVQLYGVALTAGKAHKDHKHHHAHHYEHDTSNNTPRPTRPPVTGPPLPQHPYLTAGQINHQVRIHHQYRITRPTTKVHATFVAKKL